MLDKIKVLNTITNLHGYEGHKWVVDTYNSINPLPAGYKLKFSDAWCCATISAVLHDNGYDDLAECSCIRIIEKAKKLGLWIESDSYVPDIGDLILYDWNDTGSGDNMGVPDHIGLIIGLEYNVMEVREGNKDNSIGNRFIAVDSRFIRGFIKVPYSSIQLKDQVDFLKG